MDRPRFLHPSLLMIFLLGSSVSRVLADVSPPVAHWTECAPPTRSSGVMLYDAPREQLLLFGGSGTGTGVLDLWACDPDPSASWAPLVVAGPSPTQRQYHAVCYDPVTDRYLLFGGSDWWARNDVWALSLEPEPSWELLLPSGAAPAARTSHSMIYDSLRHRLVVYGGGVESTFFSDVWALSLGSSPAWTQLVPPHPDDIRRALHVAIYDPIGDRMIVFGGADALGPIPGVWAMTLSGGQSLVPVSVSGTPPAPRFTHTGAYDPLRHELLIGFGVHCAPGSCEQLSDQWTLSLGATPTWTELAPSGDLPASRQAPSSALDASGDRLFIHGGWHDGPGTSLAHLNELWCLRLGSSPAWAKLSPRSDWPSWRTGHSAVLDPATSRMIVFGGKNDVARKGDTWACDVAGDGAWEEWVPAGGPPSPREQHSAVTDPGDRRVIVFGGNDGAYRNDCWELALDEPRRWTLLAATGTPPSPRASHAAVYDAARDRMILYGGTNGSSLADTWVLSLDSSPAWTQLATSGSVPPSANAVLVLDTARDRLVLHTSGYGGQVWTLPLSGPAVWTRMFPAGGQPGLTGHTAYYDATYDRMVVHGGNGLNTIWTLNFGTLPTWFTAVAEGWLPLGRSEHTAVFDEAGGRMWVFGGVGFYADLWSVDLSGAPSSVPGSGPKPGDALHIACASPFRPPLAIAISGTSAPAGVSLGLFDVSGRLVRSWAGLATAHGRAELAWDGLNSEGGEATPGVYFLRAEAGDRTGTARITLLR